MTVTISIWTLLFLFTAFHGLLLCGILMSSPQKRSYEPNRWALALVFCFTCLLFIYVGYWNELYLTERFIHLNQLYWPFTFLIAPLTYLYLRQQVYPEQKQSYLHLLLPALVLLIWLPFYLKSGEGKMQFYRDAQHLEFPSQLRANISVYGVLLQLGVYAFLNIRLIKDFKKQTVERENLKVVYDWLKKLAFAFAIYVLCFYTYHILITTFRFPVEWDYSLSLIMVGMIYYIGVKAYTQPELFKEREELAYAHKKEAQALIKPQEKEHYKILLLDIMEKQKPHLNEQLKLHDLAAMLELTGHQLSYFLNCYLHTNFSDFINTYRVETAKVLLLDSKKEHLKILVIGYEAGFSSKTAFYTTFKKHTQMTPTAFRKRLAPTNSGASITRS